MSLAERIADLESRGLHKAAEALRRGAMSPSQKREASKKVAVIPQLKDHHTCVYHKRGDGNGSHKTREAVRKCAEKHGYKGWRSREYLANLEAAKADA